MILAAAQTRPFRRDTEANIKSHLRLIDLAAQNGVQLIVFPEMSLTGYEREGADECSFMINDPRLEIFKERSVMHEMIIVAGAPVKINDGLHIGSFIFLPDGTSTIYTKQFLHTGEEACFLPCSDYNPLVRLEDEIISFAICADITHPVHPKNAALNNVTLYAASIFYTPAGIKEGYECLSEYAAKYAMSVVMANYSGSSYNLEAGGQSALWNSYGILTGQLDNQSEGLLIARKSGSAWKTSALMI